MISGHSYRRDLSAGCIAKKEIQAVEELGAVARSHKVDNS